MIGLLTSNIQAVLPARLNSHLLQMQQISSLLEILSYLDRIVLNKNSKIELKWWVKMACINLAAYRGVNNDRYLNKGMGSNVNRISTRGMSFA